ncbi:hypothetical protein Q5752_002084 [Cryptotrichosporon argae]
MLSSVARKATRLRSARKYGQRLYTPGVETTVESRFPLYRPAPAPAPRASRQKQTSIDDLPSIPELRRSQKAALTEDATAGLAEFDEAFLEDFYRDVLRSSPDFETEQLALPPPRMSRDERRGVLANLEQRICGVEDGQSGPSRLPATAQPHRRLAVALAAAPVADGRIPLGVLSKTEWKALAEEFLEKEENPRGVEFVLEIMTRHGVQPNPQVVEGIVGKYAALGQTHEVARLIAELEDGGMSISDTLYKLHISSHLSAAKPRVRAAIGALSRAEDAGRPYPESAYGVVLSHLTTPTPTVHTNAHTRALALDLFAHMRLAAHPTPTAAVYGIMIRSCAESNEPERARDLWLEMEAAGIRPSREEYDAIIRALGTKRDYLEAFDILRQLVAKHETVVAAGGSSMCWLPTAQTWAALLEGTKRAGDLERARWVVGEMMRYAGLGPDWAANEDIIASVFMTYAAWKPPVVRSTVRAAAASNATNVSAATAHAAGALGHSGLPTTTEAEQDVMPAPRSSADAVAEATSLFQNIIHDLSLPPSEIDPQTNPFATVRLTTRLINTYISVHLAHAPLAAARETYDKTWAALLSLGLKANAWSYLAVLERCAKGGQSAADREVARQWVEDIWTTYTALAEAHDRAPPTASVQAVAVDGLRDGAPDTKRQRWLAGLGPRQVERAWVALIRLRALDPSADASSALALVRSFHAQNPPSTILASYRPALPDTLAHSGTLPGTLKIRLTDASTTQEPDVPPHLTWNDVDVLHARLVREERAEVAELTWVCRSYQKALETRRRWRLKGAGVGRERRKMRQRAGVPVHGSADNALETGGDETEDTYGAQGWEDGAIEVAHATG